MRVTARSDRPISRWISCVRPPTLPADASRWFRVVVARGSMPYSAVTQPLPELRRNGGTRSSTLAVQMTRVSPASISTEPSACLTKLRGDARRAEGVRGAVVEARHHCFSGAGRDAAGDRRRRGFLHPGGARARSGRRDPRGRRACPPRGRPRGSARACTAGRFVGDRVDDRVYREHLVERAAGVRGRHLAAQVDERLALRVQVERAELRALGDGRQLRPSAARLELRLDESARLLERALAERHLALHRDEPQAVVRDVEQVRLDLRRGRSRRRLGLDGGWSGSAYHRGRKMNAAATAPA